MTAVVCSAGVGVGGGSQSLVSEEVRSRCHLKHRFCSMYISESASNDSIYGDLSYAASQHLGGHHGTLHHLTAANHAAPPPYSQVVLMPYVHHSVIPSVSLAHAAPTSAAAAGFASAGTNLMPGSQTPCRIENCL